jgi:hypothetical protein
LLGLGVLGGAGLLVEVRVTVLVGVLLGAGSGVAVDVGGGVDIGGTETLMTSIVLALSPAYTRPPAATTARVVPGTMIRSVNCSCVGSVASSTKTPPLGSKWSTAGRARNTLVPLASTPCAPRLLMLLRMRGACGSLTSMVTSWLPLTE